MNLDGFGWYCPLESFNSTKPQQKKYSACWITYSFKWFVCMEWFLMSKSLIWFNDIDRFQYCRFFLVPGFFSPLDSSVQWANKHSILIWISIDIVELRLIYCNSSNWTLAEKWFLNTAAKYSCWTISIVSPSVRRFAFASNLI